MFTVSNADRVVFPELGRTKGDVVAYYRRIAEKMLPHLIDRPLSIYRFPKGLADKGFFQKNVPAHYPASMGKVEIPRSKDAAKKHKKVAGGTQEFTVFPILVEAEHIPYVANQGAIELHVPTARASALFQPDRVVFDLDPPPGATELVREAAIIARRALEDRGLVTVPVATGSKGYHVTAPIVADVDADVLGDAMQKLSALLVAQYPDILTTAFRVADRGRRVFLDWLRNRTGATIIAPYSLRAKPRATIAVPLSWEELATTAPDAFNIDDAEKIADRPDSLLELAQKPSDANEFIARVSEEFDASGLELEVFDRFRS